MLKKFLERIELLMNELQLAVNNQISANASIAAKESELAGLIEDNKARSKSLDEKHQALEAKMKTQEQITDLLAREKKYDEDVTELRRRQHLLDEKIKAHDKKAAEENAEIVRKREKLSRDQEALNDEKRSYKENAKKEIIADFLRDIKK